MEEKEIKQEIVTIDGKAGALVVSDKESFEIAGEYIISCDSLIKKIKEYWKSPKEAAFKAHREITQKESDMLKPVEEKRKSLASKIKAYLTEQDRIRREEQARIDAERREQERKERERLEKMAAKAAEKGKTEKAEELREKAEDVFIAPKIVVPEVEKTTRMDSGTVSTVKDIEIKIVDEMQILKNIIDGKLPVTCVSISDTKIKSYVKQFGIKQMDGLVITETVSAKFRGK